ncbi:unnamed protein product [Closterium sp. Yama58-4]|nr:unnamed protein product [Closterium sp. Yama58-4]
MELNGALLTLALHDRQKQLEKEAAEKRAEGILGGRDTDGEGGELVPSQEGGGGGSKGGLNSSSGIEIVLCFVAGEGLGILGAALQQKSSGGSSEGVSPVLQALLQPLLEQCGQARVPVRVHVEWGQRRDEALCQAVRVTAAERLYVGNKRCVCGEQEVRVWGTRGACVGNKRCVCGEQEVRVWGTRGASGWIKGVPVRVHVEWGQRRDEALCQAVRATAAERLYVGNKSPNHAAPASPRFPDSHSSSSSATPASRKAGSSGSSSSAATTAAAATPATAGYAALDNGCDANNADDDQHGYNNKDGDYAADSDNEDNEDDYNEDEDEDDDDDGYDAVCRPKSSFTIADWEAELQRVAIGQQRIVSLWDRAEGDKAYGGERSQGDKSPLWKGLESVAAGISAIHSDLQAAKGSGGRSGGFSGGFSGGRSGWHSHQGSEDFHVKGNEFEGIDTSLLIVPRIGPTSASGAGSAAGSGAASVGSPSPNVTPLTGPVVGRGTGGMKPVVVGKKLWVSGRRSMGNEGEMGGGVEAVAAEVAATAGFAAAVTARDGSRDGGSCGAASPANSSSSSNPGMGGNEQQAFPIPFPSSFSSSSSQAGFQTSRADSADCHRFPPDQILRATGGFSPSQLIGRGRLGPSYRGEIFGCQVAIKLLTVHEEASGTTDETGKTGKTGKNAEDGAEGGGQQEEEQVVVEGDGAAVASSGAFGSFGSSGLHDPPTEGGSQVAEASREGVQAAVQAAVQVAVDVLRRLRHPHLLLLMGHCPEYPCLVYELAPGGSLSARLSRIHSLISAATAAAAGDGGGAAGSAAATAAEEGAGSSSSSGAGDGAAASPSGKQGMNFGDEEEEELEALWLSWVDRLRLASELAGALLFMHQHSPPMLHGAVTLQNVLLDRNSACKLSGAGLSFSSSPFHGSLGNSPLSASASASDSNPSSSTAAGAEGSCQHGNSSTGVLSDDVHAYGIVVLQLVTGITSPSLIHSLMHTHPAGGGETEGGVSGGGVTCGFNLAEAVDVFLSRLDVTAGEWPVEMASVVVLLALRCASGQAELRPDLAAEVQPALSALAREAEENFGRAARQMLRSALRKRDFTCFQKRVVKIENEASPAAVHDTTKHHRGILNLDGCYHQADSCLLLYRSVLKLSMASSKVSPLHLLLIARIFGLDSAFHQTPGSPRPGEGGSRVWQHLLGSFVFQWASWLGQLMAGARTKVLALGGSFASTLLLPPHTRAPSRGGPPQLRGGVPALPPITLSEPQEWCLKQLQARIQPPFENDKEEHRLALVELWEQAYPGRVLTEEGRGIFSLENLVYYARTYPRSFQRIMQKQEGRRAEWEYPFGAAGVNITVLLISILDLRKDIPATVAGRAFLKILPEHPTAFEDLYCVTFEMLDANWLELKASYMEFNVVMQATRAELERHMCQPSFTAISDLPAFARLTAE